MVKLLGKSLRYNTMRDRLARTWKLGAGFEILDIGNDFFMVKFDDEADRAKVMDGGPWMIFDHYLTVQTWSPAFASPSAKIDKTMVWIRFPGLNLFYYDESILLAMASAVGKPVKVDHNTLNIRRGRFARVCVEVDLTKPVVGKVWLKDLWYLVQYEGLHRICSSCGCYGHLGRDCPTKKQGSNGGNGDKVIGADKTSASLPPAETVAQEHSSPTTNDSSAIKDPAVTPSDSANLNANHNKAVKSQEPMIGDWMIVKRKKRNSRMTNNNNKDSARNKMFGNQNGKKEKHHAPKNVSCAYDKKVQHLSAQNTKKGTSNASPHVTNKRPRSDQGVGPTKHNYFEFSIGQAGPSHTKEPPHQSVPIDKVYELGFGAN